MPVDLGFFQRVDVKTVHLFVTKRKLLLL